MKYGQRDVIDLYVFDEEGNQVTFLNSLKNSGIYLNSSEPYVFVKDALLDTDLLKFIGRAEDIQRSDYEKKITGVQKYSTTIVLGKLSKKLCKLVGKGYMRDATTQMNTEFMFEIPKAAIMTGIDLAQSSTEVSEFDLVFHIQAFNDSGDTIKIHLQ